MKNIKKWSKRLTALLAAGSLLVSPAVPFAAEEAEPDYSLSVFASSNQDGNTPLNAVDGSMATKWAAEGKGQWLQLLLDEKTTLSNIGIAFTNGDARTYYFEIQTSLDLENWTTVFSGESAGKTNEVVWYPLTSTEAKYVKFVGSGNSVNLWNNISEIEGLRLANIDLAVKVDNAYQLFDPLPMIHGDLFYVPMKPMYEFLGAEVTLEGEKATAVYNGAVQTLTVGSATCGYDGRSRNLTAAPILKDGKMMVTIKDVTEFFGCRAELSEDGRFALLYTAQFDQSQAIFATLDAMFEDTFDWLVEVYDPETGGFYGTISARDTEGYIVGIEQTAWAVNIMSSFGNQLIKDMPAEFRQKLITFFQSRQDPETGLFINTSGSVNDRNTSRNLSAATGALTKLGAKPLYPLPGERAATVGEEEEAIILDAVQPVAQTAETEAEKAAEQKVSPAATSAETIPEGLPSYLDSTDAYREYLESRDWDNNAWTAGDNLQQTVVMLQQLPATLRQSYIDILVDFVETNQDPNTGYWGGKGSTNFNTLSGALKISLAYQTLNLKLPNPEKIVKSVITTLSSGEIASAACYVRNPVDLLQELKKYSEEINQLVEDAFPQLVEGTVNSMRALQCPDGAFSSHLGYSQETFSGIPNGLSIYESDIDGTHQIFRVRQYVYQLLGSDPGPLEEYSGCFWEKIMAKEPVVKKLTEYCEVGETAYEQNFEGVEEFSELSSEFVLKGADCTAEIVSEYGNKSLKLNDPTQSVAAYLSCRIPRIKGTTVVELRMKFDHPGDYVKNETDFSYNGIRLYGQSGRPIDLNAIESSNTLKTVSQITPSTTYTTVDTISRGEWCTIRIEFTMPTALTNNIPSVKYYVNDRLSSSAMDEWRQELTTDYIDRFDLFTSQTRMSCIYVDDIKIWRKA